MASRPRGKLERDLQMVAVLQEPPTKTSALPTLLLTSTSTAGAKSTALVKYKKGTGLKEDDEDLEVKLRQIIDHVPIRVSNTSNSSAGSGSGDFHQGCLLVTAVADTCTYIDANGQHGFDSVEPLYMMDGLDHPYG